MTDHKNLAEALSAFQAEMPTVAKSKTAKVTTKTGGSYSYAYADLADVTEAAMPALTKHGLSFTCSPIRGADNMYELRGVLLHASGEKRTGRLPIRGGTPQELGSSLTYMRRYLFGCLTGVVTDTDDDGASASKADKRQTAPAEPAQPAATRRMSRNTPTAAPQPAPEAPSQDGLAGITEGQSKMLHASFNDAGIKLRATRLNYCVGIIGRPIETSSELTKAEASRVIEALRADIAAPPEEDQP